MVDLFWWALIFDSRHCIAFEIFGYICVLLETRRVTHDTLTIKKNHEVAPIIL